MKEVTIKLPEPRVSDLQKEFAGRLTREDMNDDSRVFAIELGLDIIQHLILIYGGLDFHISALTYNRKKFESFIREKASEGIPRKKICSDLNISEKTYYQVLKGDPLEEPGLFE